VETRPGIGQDVQWWLPKATSLIDRFTVAALELTLQPQIVTGSDCRSLPASAGSNGRD